MVNLTEKEKSALLLLFKDIKSDYNANSISKILNISHVGAQKIFKRLKKDDLVKSKKIGKAIIYKLNFDNEYVSHLISFLLVDEINESYKRWVEEFRQIFQHAQIVLMFGSALKDYKSAKDIDLMAVIDNSNFKKVKKLIEEKQRVLPKKIHLIMLSEKDLSMNIANEKSAIIDIVKNAIVLYGQDKYVQLLKKFKN